MNDTERVPSEVAAATPPASPEAAPLPGGRRFENRWDLIIYLWLRIRTTRKYWLIPVLLVVGLIGLGLNLFTGHNVLPAIYSLIP